MRKWVSVDDKLPKEDQSVLIYDAYSTHGKVYTMTCSSYLLACLSGDEFSESYRGITHWMPLPKPPTE